MGKEKRKKKKEKKREKKRRMAGKTFGLGGKPSHAVIIEDEDKEGILAYASTLKNLERFVFFIFFCFFIFFLLLKMKIKKVS